MTSMPEPARDAARDAYEVVIAGAGPVGLMLACELALAGVSVVVLERLTAIDPTIKAGSLGPLAGEALARRGLEPAMAKVEQQMMQQMQAAMQAAGGPAPAGERPAMLLNARGKPIGGHFAGLFLIDQSVQAEPARRNRGVGQQMLEGMLEVRARELGAELRRGHRLLDFTQHAEHVAIHAAGGDAAEYTLTARYLVGCDGGRSFVRKHAGFEFPGTPPVITGYQALVELADPAALLPLGWRRTEVGMMAYGPVPGRILLVEFAGPPSERDTPVSVDELQAALRRVSGRDATITAIRTATRWTDNARQATTYRVGRVLLAGDAAHVHSPFGGQGLNLGIGDAVNLGWKLAAELRGRAPAGLLDSYTAERHPVAARVLANTRAQVALMAPGPHVNALRDLVADLMAIDDVNRYFGAMLGGLDLRYPVACTHPAAGRPLADLQLTLADGSAQQTSALLQDGRGLLLVLDGRAAPAGVDGLQVVHATSERADLGAALIRPDGFVAWAAAPGAPDPAGLDDALHTWLVPR
jgi:2-polyprenyl-6-methoxyphenol hydroxylase-like FAD-dependent oxidoreductase